MNEVFMELPDGFWTFGESLAGLLQSGETEKALEKLREKGSLTFAEAQDCLPAALECSDALFREVLEASPPGEYTARMTLPLPGEAPAEQKAELCGTLPILAAARGDAQKLRMLLERGMDCNAVSFAAASALHKQGPAQPFKSGFGFGFSGFDTLDRLQARQRIYGGCAAATAHFPQLRDGAGSLPDSLLSGMTPLAAAVLFGHPDCVRLLLAQPDIRVADSSAVGAAALLAAHGTRAQRACACAAFGLPLDTEDVAGVLCGGTLLAPENVAAFGTAGDLHRRLTAPGATAEEARTLLKNDALWNEAGVSAEATNKLVGVFSARPELLKEAEARDRLLRSGLKGFEPPGADIFLKTQKNSKTATGETPWGAMLLKLWRANEGPERDISAGLQTFGKQLGGQTLKEALERLEAGGGTLVAAAEAVLGCWPELDLYALLRKVRFYRCTERGISALARAIVQTQSLRLMRFSLRIGALAGEDRSALMEYIGGFGASAPLRAAILTLQPQPAVVRPLRESIPRQYWSGTEEAERGRLFEAQDALLTDGASEAEARQLLERLRDDSSVFWNRLQPPEFLTPDGRLKLHCFRAAVCCCGDPALLRLIRGQDQWREKRLWSWGSPEEEMLHAQLTGVSVDRGTLTATPLCLAAAAGNLAIVSSLLAEGADPDENDAPVRSAVDCYWKFGSVSVTPLAMALWMGRTDTAAELEIAGADRVLAEHILSELQHDQNNACEEGA